MFETQIDDTRFAKFFPLGRKEDAETALRGTLESIPSGYAMVLSSIDGQRLMHVSSRELNTSRLAAITGSFCGLGETLSKELGQEQYKDVLVQTATGISVVQRIPHGGHRMVLLTAAGSDANMGIVSSQARYCAQRLSEFCFSL